jgi:hypothetical protein
MVGESQVESEDWRKVGGVGVYCIDLEIEKGGPPGPKLNTTLIIGRLRVPLEINHAERRGDLLETCVRSFNLRARRICMNQIRTVYMPLWQQDTNEDVWKNFENILFSDQRKNDRVARFHTYAEYN